MSVQEILALFSSGSTAVITLVVILYLATNSSLSSWFELANRVRNRKIEYAQDFLQRDDKVSNETEAIVRDVSEARVLRRVVGIYAESKMRERLLELHQLVSDGNIDWRTIRIAYPHLELTGRQPLVRSVNRGEKLLLKLSWFATSAILLALLACVLIASYLLSFSPFPGAWVQAIEFVFYAIAFSFFAQAFISYPRSRQAAEMIGARLSSQGNGT